MTLRLNSLLGKYPGRVVMRLATGAMVSSLPSTLIAAHSGKLLGQNASHPLFMAAVALVALLSGGTRYALRWVDAGLVLVVMLFEPIGPVLLHHEAAPPGLILTLLLGFALACFWGHEGRYGRLE